MRSAEEAHVKMATHPRKLRLVLAHLMRCVLILQAVHSKRQTCRWCKRERSRTVQEPQSVRAIQPARPVSTKLRTQRLDSCGKRLLRHAAAHSDARLELVKGVNSQPE
eukprot:scaffold32117_cov35-Tisochrysis_lutea.AAC.1